MRQVLPSLLKTLHRGQKSSICESEKGYEGGWPSDASRLPSSIFSKSSFPKLTPLISMIFVHDESIPKKKAFSRRASKSFGEAAGEGLRRWLSIRRGSRAIRRDPLNDLPGEAWQVGGQLDELCILVFPHALEWEIVTRPFANKGVPIGISESDNACWLN